MSSVSVRLRQPVEVVKLLARLEEHELMRAVQSLGKEKIRDPLIAKDDRARSSEP